MVHSLPGHQRRNGPGISDEGGELLGEVSSLDELHAEVLLTLMLADFINRDDARVIEQSHRLGLVLKSPKLGVIGQDAGPDHLESDRPVEGKLAGLVNDAHAAAAQFSAQLIVAKVAELGSHGQGEGVAVSLGRRLDYPVCGRRIGSGFLRVARGLLGIESGLGRRIVLWVRSGHWNRLLKKSKTGFRFERTDAPDPFAGDLTTCLRTASIWA